MAAVEIDAVVAKGRDLGDALLRLRAVVGDEYDSEVGADGKGLRKHLQHHIGERIGGHVKIFWREAEQEVAHASAGEVRCVSLGAQPLDNLFCCDLYRTVLHEGSLRFSMQADSSLL